MSELNTVYTLTPDQVDSITDIELAFATERLLPSWDDIPQGFREGNQYTDIAEAVFAGYALPDGTIEMKPGFTPEALNRAVRAHLQSFGPKHEHKIAGVGLLIASACTFTRTPGRGGQS